ncbi:MAG: hypothetical protein ACREC0_03750 [Methylocella sp.]
MRIRATLDLKLTECAVIADSIGKTPFVFLAGLHRAERAIADRQMRENGLRAQQMLRLKRTTDSHHAWPVAKS